MQTEESRETTVAFLGQNGECGVSASGESRVLLSTLAGLDSVQVLFLPYFYFLEKWSILHNILYFYTINCFSLFLA